MVLQLMLGCLVCSSLHLDVTLWQRTGMSHPCDRTTAGSNPNMRFVDTCTVAAHWIIQTPSLKRSWQLVLFKKIISLLFPAAETHENSDHFCTDILFHNRLSATVLFAILKSAKALWVHVPCCWQEGQTRQNRVNFKGRIQSWKKEMSGWRLECGKRMKEREVR